MNTINLNTWVEFKEAISALYGDCEKLREKVKPRHVSEPVFRGQADSDWKLETTLEREARGPFPVELYHLHLVTPSLRMLSGTSLLEAMPEENLDLSYDSINRTLPLYEKLGFLRHHGFPSPLLDWSYSPFVAAYFAFSLIPVGTRSHAAIFCYQEYFGDGKMYERGKPKINCMGPWAGVHERHIRQRSTYTYCVCEINERMRFVSHADAEKSDNSFYPQSDVVTKFVIPLEDRKNILIDLHRMNITAFSLFGTEDALVQTVGALASNNVFPYEFK